MTEQAPETQGQGPAPEQERKLVVFAVRIDPVPREQIEGLRGITEQSVNDVGVEALNDWVSKTLADEAISQKAMAELDAEEQRLKERRAAIADILGQAATADENPPQVTLRLADVVSLGQILDRHLHYRHLSRLKPS